ncbi:MAG: hypothetical protein KKH98_04310 [Spirochaetes bacterium]|nr:hypothetical protein [Spirochaetota bacterium]
MVRTHRIRKYLAIFLLCAVIIFLSGMDLKAGAFDKFGVGARPIALGGTYLAYARGPETLFWNPSGLSLADNPELTAMYSDLYSLDLLNYWYLGFTYPDVAYGNIGIGMMYLGTSNNPMLGNLEHSQNTVILSYAYSISPYINLGLSIKTLFVRSSKEAMGFGFDLGILSKITETLRVGVMLNDFTDTRIKWAKETGITGPAEDIIERDLGAGIYFQPFRFAFFLIDYTGVLTGNESLHSGIGIIPIEHVSIRGGLYQQGNEYNFTFGFGIDWKRWQFDYALNSHFELDPTSIFSISYKFGDINKGDK